MPPKRKHKDDDEDWVPSDNQSTVNYRKIVNKSAHSKEIKEHCLNLLNLYEQDPDNNGTGMTAVQTILKLPIQLHVRGNTSCESHNELLNILDNSWQMMERCVYGHRNAKLEVLQYHVSRLLGKGTPRILGLVGPPGVGKTSLAVNGIAKALDLPLYQMSLGGLRDVTYFTGSLPCWKGSHHGVFTDILIAHGSRALVYIDEVDKVAHETAGDIYGWLTHALDPLANHSIKDTFLGVNLDLSGLTFIFSYNDPSVLPMPLRDRIKEIYLDGFTTEEKIHIIKHFIWPECLSQYGLTVDNIILSDEIIAEANTYLIKEDDGEDLSGVRYLKKFYQSLVDNLMLRIMSTKEGYKAFKKTEKQEPESLNLSFMKHINPIYSAFPYEVQLSDIIP